MTCTSEGEKGEVSIHLVKAALSLALSPKHNTEEAFNLVFAVLRMNEAWNSKRLIGKAHIGTEFKDILCP